MLEQNKVIEQKKLRDKDRTFAQKTANLPSSAELSML